MRIEHDLVAEPDTQSGTDATSQVRYLPPLALGRLQPRRGHPLGHDRLRPQGEPVRANALSRLASLFAWKTPDAGD
jgi:hypothetical protein